MNKTKYLLVVFLFFFYQINAQQSSTSHSGNYSRLHSNTSANSIVPSELQLTDFYVPTGFTPNGDGKNDRIRPLFGSDLTMEEFRILNRWGQTIYITYTRDEGWDGKVNNTPQNPGVFVWILKAVDRTGIHYQKQGTFALIR